MKISYMRRHYYSSAAGLFICINFVFAVKVILFDNEKFPFISKDYKTEKYQCRLKSANKLPYQFDYSIQFQATPNYAQVPKPVCNSFGEWLKQRCSLHSSNTIYSDYNISELFELVCTHQDYVKINSRYLINCGAHDGQFLDPLYSMFVQHKYPGIAIELDKGLYEKLVNNLPSKTIIKVNQALQPNTVQHIFREHNVPKNPLLLKIDIDGYDYTVVRSLFTHSVNNCRTEFNPAIVMLEMNEKIPPPISFYTRYRTPYLYKDDHLYGASITAWTRLLSHDLGYVLLGVYDFNNLIYIRYDIAQYLKLLYQFPHNSYDVWVHGYWNRSERDTKFSWNRKVLHWNDHSKPLLVRYRDIDQYFHSTKTFTENVNCSYFMDIDPIYIESD